MYATLVCRKHAMIFEIEPTKSTFPFLLNLSLILDIHVKCFTTLSFLLTNLSNLRSVDCCILFITCYFLFSYYKPYYRRGEATGKLSGPAADMDTSETGSFTVGLRKSSPSFNADTNNSALLYLLLIPLPSEKSRSLVECVMRSIGL